MMGRSAARMPYLQMFAARFPACALVVVPCVCGCAARIPRGALAMNPQTLEARQRSTRRFSTLDEARILTAGAGLLQDLGFVIDESETDLGLIVASKSRTAVDAGQVAAKIAWAVVLGVDVPIDASQTFRVSVVTRGVGDDIVLRVTFQRIVWDDKGRVSRLELLGDPKLYQEFFDKLSKAVFLEAHEI